MVTINPSEHISNAKKLANGKLNNCSEKVLSAVVKALIFLGGINNSEGHVHIVSAINDSKLKNLPQELRNKFVECFNNNEIKKSFAARE